ncbi:MAG: DUF2442 domain-containing protein [Bacteroidetes bacterium]|nr:DUF2442 domain-containing protein [Bacteroidota bacterium]
MIAPKVTQVKALDNYLLWVEFADGKQGKIDLSNLKGKGVFAYWDDYEKFKNVYIDSETMAIAWSEELDICPTTIYKEINGTIAPNA